MANKPSGTTTVVCLIVAVLGIAYFVHGYHLVGGILVFAAAAFWFAKQPKTEGEPAAKTPGAEPKSKPKPLHDAELEGVRRVDVTITDRTNSHQSTHSFDVDAPDSVLCRPELREFASVPDAEGAHYCYRVMLDSSLLTDSRFGVDETSVRFFDGAGNPLSMERIRWAFDYFPEADFAFLLFWPKA